MKLYKYASTLVLAAMSAAMVSCDNDFDRPPVIVPEASYEVNTSISEFKEMFWNVAEANSSQIIPLNADGDSIIIGGRVISSDKDGNVYQHIYFRDESGAMDIRIYGYDLYESYPMGQDVRINVTGLLVGGYGKQMQIGVEYNGSVGGMDKDEFLVRAQRNGLPDISKAEPYTVTLEELDSYINNKADLIDWQCQLVKIENVSFVGGGSLLWTDKPGETGSTNRELKDAQGKTITVRTSNKSTFAGEVLPAGTGSVIAILTSYNTTWQLTFMDPQSGCIDGFEFPETPSEPSDDTIFSAPFTEGMDDFTIENVSLASGLEYVWKFDSKYGMVASGYATADYDSDSWLISPVIDLTGVTSANLSFEQAWNFFADIETAKSQATVNIREAGTTAWTTLSIPNVPESLSWTYVNTGNINLSAFAGKKVEIGFHYVSTAAKAGTWELRGVVIE